MREKLSFVRNFLYLSSASKSTSCQTLSASPPGSDYIGTVSVSESGRDCQPWNPQNHFNLLNKEMSNIMKTYGTTNYCRNPDPKTAPKGVWCYTSKPFVGWEYCSQIPGLFNFLHSEQGSTDLKISSLKFY